MSDLSRRAMLRNSSLLSAAMLLGACTTTPRAVTAQLPAAPGGPLPTDEAARYALMYGPVEGEPFPVRGVDPSLVRPAFLRREVDYATDAAPGTIVVDPAAHYLYLVQPAGRATRYGVGVGREGFEWSGEARVNSKQEWPDWYPLPEMLERSPEIIAVLQPLQSGVGVPGGPTNPLGARALYLWQGNKDTFYRIHGTTEPQTIGLSVSSGCIRMINQDAMDLYERVPVGTTVKVLPAKLV